MYKRWVPTFNIVLVLREGFEFLVGDNGHFGVDMSWRLIESVVVITANISDQAGFK